MSKNNVTVERLSALDRALERYGDRALLLAASSLERQANEIMNASKSLVPVRDGHLRDSGHVQPAQISGTSVTVLFGYGGVAAPYALPVHENPRSGKTGGVSPSGKKYKTWAQVGQWKYLEEPFNAMRPLIAGRLADDLRTERR